MPSVSSPDNEDDGRRRPHFDRADAVLREGNFDYAIEMYIQGLRVDPDNVAAHQRLRRISLQRKAAGGPDLSMLDKLTLKAGRSKLGEMLCAEKLLAYSPADPERLVNFYRAAEAESCGATAAWLAMIIRKFHSEM
jgi:hypothetical protein